MPRLLHHADEHVLQGELPFLRADHFNSVRFQRLRNPLLARLNLFVGDDVKALAELRYSPTRHLLLQQVGGSLRLIDNELEQMPRLRAFDAAGAAFGHQFARHHKADAIALLGFFQIVGGHQNRCAKVG